ncbi:MAG: PA14 domain-containing protein [Lentisphaeria bacterium]|nr:PA14 domain-containing protein [Lentisphaeria bacterium]
MGLAKPTLDDELKQYHWFLKKLPNHPRAIDYLNGAWEIEMTKSKKTAAANMDKMMLDCKIPPRTIYAFRRSRTYLGHRYIKQWHALGPFPTNFEKDDLVIPLPHMKAKIDLRDKYVFPKQTLVWTALTSKKNQVRPYPKHRAGDIHSNSVYAVSWIKMEKAGVYVLEFAQRGAARVWVNRRLVHNDPGEDIRVWRPRNYIDYSPMDVKPYAVSLPKGWSRILVESSPGLGGWRFTAEIIRRDGKGPVTTTKVMVPRKGPVPTTASTTRTPSFSRGHGLKAAYYDEGNFTNLKHVKIEKNTNVVWSIESPAPGVHRDYFSTRMIAKIKPRFTETYTFTVQVNDGVRLWVDGKLLIHNWRHHSSRKDRAKIKLEKDKLYDIKIEAHEITDWAGLHIWWGSASQRKEIIPNSRLFANWHDTDTFIADERATKPGGPPRFAGYKIRPDSVWMPAGWSFTYKAVPLDQYGAVLNVNKAFDESGKPVDTSPKWTAEPGGYVNLFRQYGGGRYLPNRKKKASGTINANGTFKSDGSKGVVTIIATSKKYPEISARVPLAVDDMPSIMPMPSDLTIGQFAGDIDRIRISSSELTPQEIANRAKGKFAPDKNLIADWTFDKLVGNGFENMVEKNKQLKAVIVGNVRHITEGKITYARFDGGNCVVKRNHLLNFSQSATIELWVRPLVKRPAGIMLDQCRWGTVQGYRIFFSGLSTHGLYSHGGMYAGHTYQTDKFTYLAVVYGKNGKRQLFINGKLKTERKTGPQVVGN